MNMQIQLIDQILINKTPLKGDLSLTPTGVNLLTGPNGIGKSTLFHYLKENAKELFPNMRLSFLDQKALSPISQLNVEDVISCVYDELSHLYEDKVQMYELINFFEIRKLLKTAVMSLSGGENQLIKILLCLCQKADFYLMDEPFHFLDFKNYEKLMQLIEKRSINNGFFIIEHRNEKLVSISKRKFELSCAANAIVIKDSHGSN